MPRLASSLPSRTGTSSTSTFRGTPVAPHRIERISSGTADGVTVDVSPNLADVLNRLVQPPH